MAINIFEGTKKICREMFGDSKGVISLGHSLTGLFGLAAVTWIFHVLIAAHGAVSALSAVPWEGITTFVLAPYGTNKIMTTAQAFSQNPVTGTAQPVIPSPPTPNT